MRLKIIITPLLLLRIANFFQPNGLIYNTTPFGRSRILSYYNLFSRKVIKFYVEAVHFGKLVLKSLILIQEGKCINFDSILPFKLNKKDYI